MYLKKGKQNKDDHKPYFNKLKFYEDQRKKFKLDIDLRKILNNEQQCENALSFIKEINLLKII